MLEDNSGAQKKDNKSNLKILYVATWIPFPEPCGGTTHVGEVAKHLIRRGHDVIVAAKQINGLGKEKVNGLNVFRFSWLLRDVPSSKSIIRGLHALQLVKICIDNKIDIILERESSDGSGGLAAKMLGLPMVEEVNDLQFHIGSLQYAQKILCVTNDNDRIIPKKFRDKVEVISNAVDTKAITPETKPVKIQGIPKGRPIIGYIGAFYPWHGLEEIVKAAKQVCAKTNAMFVLVGGTKYGSESQSLEELKRGLVKYGIQDRFIFTGKVPHDQIGRYIAAFDICLAPFNPIKHEPFNKYGYFFSPLKIFEYMAAGKAIISTNVGSLPSILGDQRGILVQPGNSKALGEVIIDLINNPTKISELGKNARAFAEKNSWERRSEEIEGFLFEAINKLN